MSKATLEQTKGKIKLTGIVTGIGNENSFREGFTKNTEKAYKSLSFFLQTSTANRVKVEIFGMVRDQVVAYSQKAKESKKIDWKKRSDNHGDYKVLGINAYLEKGDDSKNKRVVLVEYDAIDYIKAQLKDGESVRIQGQPQFGIYVDKQGVEHEQTQFVINTISKLDEPLNLEALDFKEEAIFEQEIVVSETMVDDESKKLIINAFTIRYGGETTPATFVVDADALPKLANNMAKRLSFGDFIKVFGKIINSVIITENTETTTVTDDDDWGGDDEIQKDFENNYIRDYIQELQVTSVDSSTYEQKKYKEEDLLSKDEDTFNGKVNDEGDDFNDDDEIEIDDLPF